MTDPQINVARMPEFDALLDHIYEYGTASEGIIDRANAFARALLSRYGQAPSAAMSDEIEALRAHVALLKAALAQAERENDELRAQPAAAPEAPVQPIPGWQLVPVEPTAEWVDALSERGLRIGTLRNAIADVLAAAPQADGVLADVDPLQGAANWLAEAHGQFCVAVLQGRLMIGYNRAKRLHDAAIAARKQGGG